MDGSCCCYYEGCRVAFPGGLLVVPLRERNLQHMKELNYVGKQIVSAGDRSPYDTEAINIIKDKQYLAWILRDCVAEFKGMSISEIIPCIEDLSAGTVSAEPGLTNSGIAGEDTSSKIIGEGILTYDIRFSALAPDDIGNVVIRLRLDVELQKNENPGYDLVPRGILYCGRMLSEQLGHNVKGDNYDNLQKVYSIWICMNTANKRANTVSKYSIFHEPIYGEFNDESRSDLLQVILIRLPKKHHKGELRNSPTKLMELLSTTFDQDIKAGEKLGRLEKMGISISEEMRRQVNVMCNLSQGILEEGLERGRAEGRAEGKNMTLDILDRREFFPEETLEMTAKAVGCSIEEVEQIVNHRKRSWKS